MSNVTHLESPKLAVTLSNRGARLVQLVAKRQNLPLLVDTARVATELIDQFCIGGTVGPFAGRLRQIDATNAQSALLLHGNEAALHRVDWILEPSRQPNVATYTVRRRHGEGGLPGDRVVIGEAAIERVEDTDSGAHDVRADAVGGDDCNACCRHGNS